MRLKHQVELPWRGQLATAFGAFITTDLVCAKALFALLTIDHQVVEALHMPRSFPYPRMGYYRTIQPHDIIAAIDQTLPPMVAYFLFQYHSLGSVIPEAGQSSVDLAALEHKSPALAKGDQLPHFIFR